MTRSPDEAPIEPPDAGAADPPSGARGAIPAALPETPRTALPASLLQRELRRIVESAAFRQSARHRRFLEYLVAHAVRSDGARLKEMTLGIEVFDRRASTFDPQCDTIVRVEARRLRRRLARYYAGEGARSPIEIALPVGTYVPQITRRGTPDQAVAASLAVLPALAATGDVAALGDDLTDALIDALARLPGLKVIAHHSASRFREPDASPRDLHAIGAMLGVGLLLRSAVGRDDDVVRWRMKLLRVADAAVVWTDVRTLGADIDFARRAAVAAEVADALYEHLTRGDLPREVRPPSLHTPVDRRALELVDRGRFLMRQGTADASMQALARFREATAIAPDCAPAHYGIARVQNHRAGMTLVEPREAVAEARSAASRALAIDPAHAEARSLLASITWRYDRDWPRAHTDFLAAIDAAPGSLYVHYNYAFALLFARRFDEADAELALSRELDPLDIGLRAVGALLAMYRRDDAAADAILAAVLDDEPRHLLARSLVGALRLMQHRPADALREYRACMDLAPSISIGSVGVAQALAMASRPDEARAERERLVRSFEARYLSPYQLAMIARRLGEDDTVFVALANAAATHDPNFITLLVDPTFEALRSDPRFAALVASTGLDRV